MKRILLLFLYIILFNKVYAREEYTEYIFDSYIKEIKEENELTKYEPVLINRFYELVETNITYKEQGTLLKDEHIDTKDYKEKRNYQGYRQYRYTNFFTNSIKIMEDYYVTEIILDNFDTDTSSIREIEINNNKIDFKIEGYEFLTDKNKSYEQRINGETIIISLEKPILISELEITFFMASLNSEDFTFDIIIDDKINERVSFDMMYSESKNCIVNFKNLNELNEILVNNQIYSKTDINKLNIFSYVFYITNFYKHYFLEKNYVVESDLKELEGLIYDENESYMGYKVFKREKIAKKTPQNKNVKYKALGTIEFKEENIILDEKENKLVEIKDKEETKIKPINYSKTLIVILILISIVNILIFIL